MAEDLTLEDARELLMLVQAHYWTELDNQIFTAANGRWSIGIEDAVAMLVRLIDATGADWERVPMVLLPDVYGAVLKVAGASGPHLSTDYMACIEREIGYPREGTHEANVMTRAQLRRVVVAAAIEQHAAELRESAGLGVS